MSEIVVGSDLGSVIAKQLGLVTESGFPMPGVRRIIIFMAVRQDNSPWEYIQYDEDAIVIRVWDKEDQAALCNAFCMDASSLFAALIDISWDSIATVIYHGWADVGDDLPDAIATLERIAGSPLTSTHLPAGPLSAHGVRVPGYVVEGNLDITAGARGTGRPYEDLELP